VPALKTSIQAQKKRHMLCIVVLRLSVVFQLLMLLNYQIGLDFAFGVGSVCGDRITIRAVYPIRTLQLDNERQPLADERLLDAFRIYRIFIVSR
jgi:hypothetical protein